MTASLPAAEPASSGSRAVLDPAPSPLPLRGLGLRVGDLIMADTEHELVHRIMVSKHVLDPKVCESPTAILDRARKKLAEKADFGFDSAEIPPYSPGVPTAGPNHLEEAVFAVPIVVPDPATEEPAAAILSLYEPAQPPRANTYDTFDPFRHRASARHRHLDLTERAYFSASKSPSTPLAGRFKAAHSASVCHRKRTGLGFCITTAAVLSEGTYAGDFERCRPKWADPSVAEFKPAVVRLVESIGVILCPDPVMPRSPSPAREMVNVPGRLGWCLERQSQEMEGVCTGIVKRREVGWYEWEKDPGDLLVPAVVKRYWRPCRVSRRPSRLFDQGRGIGNLVASAGRCEVEAGGLGSAGCEVGCVWS